MNTTDLATMCLDATVDHFRARGVYMSARDIVGTKRHVALTAARRHAARLMAGTELMTQDDIGRALRRERSMVSDYLRGSWRA